MLELNFQLMIIGARARTGLKDAPVNGYAKICMAHMARPMAIGAETFLAMIDRVLQVFVKVTQVKKNDPNTSNAKPEPAVLPFLLNTQC